jgi:RNA polymerase sigma-70 factor (ECF subfamily)
MRALNNFEEKLIVKRARAGDRDAFAEIYDFYVVKIFRFVYLKTSSKEMAEDLTSDVFLRYWQHIKNSKEKKEKEGNNNDVSGGEIEKIGSFLYKIARNLIIDFYKKKEIATVEIDAEVKNRVLDQRQDILANINRKQDIEELREALNYIRDEYREIIILRYVEDLSTIEIAEITEKSANSVRVQLHRAIKSLERVMMSKREAKKKKFIV